MTPELLFLCGVGAASGLVAGLVGLAGGIVIVPALTWIYGPQALHTAIVISWFSVMFNSVGAAANQWRIRTVPERAQLWRGARWYLLGAALATPVIAMGATQFRGLVDQQAVAVLQLCLALVMLFPVKDGGRVPRVHPVRDASFGGLIGTVSTVIGVGGGSYTIAYFVYGAGSRFRDAIATANFAGLTVGVLSVAGYLCSVLLLGSGAQDAAGGPISSWGIAAMVLAGGLAAPLGGMLSARLPVRALRQLLVLALVGCAARLLWM
ncbi:MAG TPA: sulfite exporter TauE/SafE family protein [Ramlibacter sp.]|nr:sulfite exporter TauE/SafE family protein [Ramlibacter sp.]